MPIFSRFGADFFTVYADFSRFIRDINGEKKTPRYWWSFSRLVFHGLPPLEIWGGGTKRMAGGKRTRERALPKTFGPLQRSFWSALSWIFVQEKQSTDTWGGWKTYNMRGGFQNPFLGGVSFVRFTTPLFFHLPMASSDTGPNSEIQALISEPNRL